MMKEAKSSIGGSAVKKSVQMKDHRARFFSAFTYSLLILDSCDKKKRFKKSIIIHVHHHYYY